MASTGAMKRPPKGEIRVSSKTLIHISQGIYRSTASTLRELVSNAYDVDATEVVITTNPPRFDHVTCTDNGAGMTLDAFIGLMDGGIGDSGKRVGKGLTAKLRRPVIGRIGIGLLAVAQLSNAFEVWSHHRDTETAFHGTVTLHDRLSDEADQVDPDTTEILPMGEYDTARIPFDPKRTGTTIVVSDVKRGFTRKHAPPTEFHAPPTDFRQFLDRCFSERRISSLGHYWELLWGLAVQCPIPYLPEGPTGEPPALAAASKRLNKQGLRLVVDQLRLWKPGPWQRLDGSANRNIEAHMAPFELDKPVAGKPLKVSGYLYAQNEAIKPTERRGVLVRIRDVGIGGYDRGFLDYDRASEGPRAHWISGELYVEQGLENALNVDRDSFNEMHPHYLYLQEQLHETLLPLFRGMQSGQRKRRAREHREQEEQSIQRLLGAIKDVTNVSFSFETAADDTGRLVRVDRKRRKIYVDEGAEWPSGSATAELAKLIAVARAVADSEPRKHARKRDEVFLHLLREVL